MSVNNGSQKDLTIGEDTFTVGVVDRGKWTEVSYSADGRPRPDAGADVVLDGKTRKVLSSEPSPYVRGFLVLRVSNG